MTSAPGGGVAVPGDVAPGFDAAEIVKLAAGETLLLSHRPDETGKNADDRFVTTARYFRGSRDRIWEVINDKESAATFIDGVLESKVIEREGNRILVEQRTRVGGPKGDYRYRLEHVLTPMSRAIFTYEGGELKDVEGGWWIFDGPDEVHRNQLGRLEVKRHSSQGPVVPHAPFSPTW